VNSEIYPYLPVNGDGEETPRNASDSSTVYVLFVIRHRTHRNAVIILFLGLIRANRQQTSRQLPTSSDVRFPPEAFARRRNRIFLNFLRRRRVARFRSRSRLRVGLLSEVLGGAGVSFQLERVRITTGLNDVRTP